jgi:heme exporter protein A
MTRVDPIPSQLQLDNIRCERGDRLLIKDLSVALNPGDVLQVEGANGSGKTTLLRTLCGLSQPIDGEIRWGGRPIHRIRSEYHAQLTYIGHLPGIKADLTPLENLQFLHGLHGREPADDMAVLDRIGLFGFEDVPARYLSAGQRRRVALARLLVDDTRLWILDEPFTAIDRTGTAILGEILAEFVEGGGMVVLTSHQPVAITRCEVTRLSLQ